MGTGAGEMTSGVTPHPASGVRRQTLRVALRGPRSCGSAPLAAVWSGQWPRALAVWAAAEPEAGEGRSGAAAGRARTGAGLDRAAAAGATAPPLVLRAGRSRGGWGARPV